MALAANTVIADQGGFCVVEGGEVIAHVPLPVGGILSEQPLDEFGLAVKRLREAMESSATSTITRLCLSARIRFRSALRSRLPTSD